MAIDRWRDGVDDSLKRIESKIDEHIAHHSNPGNHSRRNGVARGTIKYGSVGAVIYIVAEAISRLSGI